MHTYIHTQPAPSFPPGGREGGEEGRRRRKVGGWAGGGGAGRDALFPLTWALPVPHSQASGVSWVQAWFSRNPGKLGSTGNQPVGDWRESSAGTLIQRTVDPARGSSSLHPPQTLYCRDLCSPPLGVGRWGWLLPRPLPERLGNCYGWRTLLVLTRSLDLQTSFFSKPVII